MMVSKITIKRLSSRKGLDKQSIHYKAKNGVLVLSGSVKNAEQRKQAGELASKGPNVRRVVNQLEVHP